MDGGHCSVCGTVGCGAHAIGGTYPVECGQLITNIGGLEAIAFVARPATPEARIASISVARQTLEDAQGGIFQPGDAIACLKCRARTACCAVREWYVGAGEIRVAVRA